MSKRCEDCGCTLEGNHCTNCHEEAYILDTNTQGDLHFNKDFCEKADEQREQIAEKLKED